MTQKKTQLPVVNPHAAGIDVGSRTHFVAVGQQPEDVASFGCYTADLLQLSKWLQSKGITTIALESTGTYWKGLFRQLQNDGFEVLLVNGKHTRNVRGRKTDVLDCQWIQPLHSLGLLSGSFLPDECTAVLREYVRQRDHLIEQAATYVKKMQQSLRQMNIRLDVAIRDIVGMSGKAIVQAILQGERNPYALAALANWRVKKSKEEIALSLQGTWKDEHLFELKMSLELYEIFQQKIAACDKEIDNLLSKSVKQKKASIEPIKPPLKTEIKRKEEK
jgi:transposase